VERSKVVGVVRLYKVGDKAALLYDEQHSALIKSGVTVPGQGYYILLDEGRIFFDVPRSTTASTIVRNLTS